MTAQVTPTKPNFFSPVQTVLITVAVFFLGQVLVALTIILFMLIIAPLTGTTRSELWSQDNAWGQFTYVLMAAAAIVYLLGKIMQYRSIRFSDIGLTKPKLGHLGYALAGFGVYFASYFVGLVLITILMPGLDLQKEQQIGFSKTTTGLNLLPIFISLAILTPLMEEIVARGFLFTGVRSKLRFRQAAVITSLVFASAHLAGAKDGLLWIAAVDTLILSLVMCYVREKTNSLWPSIGMHFIKNSMAFFVLFNLARYIK